MNKRWPRNFSEKELLKVATYLAQFRGSVPTKEQAAALKSLALLVSRADQIMENKPTEEQDLRARTQAIRSQTEAIEAICKELRAAIRSVTSAYMTVRSSRVN